MSDGAPAGAFRRYGLFFLISLALALAPGPDILFVFAQSLAYGWEAGFCVTFGLCTGLCVHVTLAAFGVGLFLQRHPKAFTAVTILYARGCRFRKVPAPKAASVTCRQIPVQRPSVT